MRFAHADVGLLFRFDMARRSFHGARAAAAPQCRITPSRTGARHQYFSAYTIFLAGTGVTPRLAIEAAI